MSQDRDAGHRARFPEYEALGIPLDFTAEAYKSRLKRIWELAHEGRGPVIEMRKLFQGSGES